MTLATLGRTLADSRDRESWLAVHDSVIGASTAAKFARMDSAESYADQMLEPRTFHGNAATAHGNEEEPLLLAWAGATQNTLFIHSPANPRFAATPDGVIQTSTGFRLAETKTKHNYIVTGPSMGEIRQMAWQLLCIPEAEGVDFVWGTYVNHHGEWKLRSDPETITYYPDHPAIISATNLIVPIAHAVIGHLEVRALEGALS